MDNYCIERGTLLDNPSLETLQNPDKHSIHCLVDVASCRNSDFELLSLEADDDGVHCRAYTLDDTGRSLSVDLARSVGTCSSCDGGGGQKAGFKALFVGTVSDPISTNPLLTTEQVLPSGSSCPAGYPLTTPESLSCSSGGYLAFL